MAWVARVVIVVLGLLALGYAASKVMPPKLLEQVEGWLAPIGGDHARRPPGPLIDGDNPRDPEPPPDPPPAALTELDRWRAQPKVILDPGHGGSDPGTSAETPYEKTLVLDLALRVARCLREKRIPVELTRTEDIHLDLAARVSATVPHPRAILVSLHMNGGEGAEWNGIETFWSTRQGEALPQTQRRRLQQRSLRLAQLVQASVIEATDANDRGVKQANYKVLRECALPAVLVEAGFLSNRAERNRLEQVEYREKLAAGIAAGIERAWREELMIPPPADPGEAVAAPGPTPVAAGPDPGGEEPAAEAQVEGVEGH